MKNLRAIRRCVSGGVLVGLVALLSAPIVSAEGADEVVIWAAEIYPEVLRTSIERRVTFTNRSGRFVHVEFIGDSGEHHVVQVLGKISVTFYRPGRHPYEVHFLTGRGPDLRGVVEVADNPDWWEGPPTCTGVTAMETCIEP